MGKPSSKARAIKHRIMKRVKKSGSNANLLKCVYWNANGMHCLCKQQEVIDLMENESVDLLMVDETHFKKDSNIDLSAFSNYSPIFIERDVGVKQGGGKMILFSDRIKATKWTPPMGNNEWINSERTWILIHNNKSRIAICSVYMACESVTSNDFKEWNDQIYAAISKEVTILKSDGYKCAIIGDLNAHVGLPPRGIEGNRPGVNHNGKKLLSFIEENELIMINKHKDICNGTFTRITPHSSAILDYVLVTQNMMNDVLRMGIDTDIEILAGSDHVAIRLDINLVGGLGKTPEPKKYSISLSEKRDMKLAMNAMDIMIDEVNWDDLTLNEAGNKLQQILIASNVNSYNTAPVLKRKPRNVFKLKRLKRQRKELEKKEKGLSLIKIKRAINNEEWTVEDQESLNAAVKETRAVSEAISNRSFELKAKNTQKLRLRDDVKNEIFWSLVKKTEKKKGGLTSLKGPDGKVETEREKVADLAITGLANIFNGKKSPIFESHGEQIIKEITVKNSFNYEKWTPKVNDEFKHEDEVCAPCSIEEVKKVVKGLKIKRAPGVDGVLTTMLKNASDKFICHFTGLINNCFRDGDIPQVFNTGKMTLIDKKEPSLEITKKRPLTVSSVMLCVITKIIHARMNIICEREGLYGIIQYGFRKQRSTTDCVFIILSAIKTARRKHKTISIAFCDIAKAYDSVCRELLYTKLRYLGFGGRVVSIIRSMYYNDSVRISLESGVSEPLYFTQGVKQGCSLSPLLFSLYIAQLGTALHRSKLGINIGAELITALFFADDLVLISGTPKTGMIKLLKLVNNFCEDNKMSLATSKTYIISNASYNISWPINEETIEEVLVAKYLGVNIQLRGRSMIGQYEELMINRATSYAYSIMNLTRGGLDRALIAKRIWETCAIPAILYCVEAITIKKSTVKELERIQNMVGRFILQVPPSTSRALAWMDAGLMPMQYRIYLRQSGFIFDIFKTKNNPTLLKILREQLDNPSDPWTKSWRKIETMVGNIFRYKTKKLLLTAVTRKAVAYVMNVKRQHSTLITTPQPWNWFKIQNHVNDTKASRILCQVRGGNAQLGNRYKNRYGVSYDVCPHCEVLGLNIKLTESHVIFECPVVAKLRRDLYISNFMSEFKAKGPIANVRVLRAYLGGDGSTGQTLMVRGKKLGKMIESWLTAVHEPL